MWKAQAGHAPTVVDKKDDDDWETEPDFVNDVSEKEQRWGAKTLDTTMNQFGNGNLTPAELARRAVAAHEAKSKEEADAIKAARMATVKGSTASSYDHQPPTKSEKPSCGITSRSAPSSSIKDRFEALNVNTSGSLDDETRARREALAAKIKKDREEGERLREKEQQAHGIATSEKYRQDREHFEKKVQEREAAEHARREAANTSSSTVSDSERIRKEREAFDASVRRREEAEHAKREASHASQGAGVSASERVRQEREAFEQSVRQREEVEHAKREAAAKQSAAAAPKTTVESQPVGRTVAASWQQNVAQSAAPAPAPAAASNRTSRKVSEQWEQAAAQVERPASQLIPPRVPAAQEDSQADEWDEAPAPVQQQQQQEEQQPEEEAQPEPVAAAEPAEQSYPTDPQYYEDQQPSQVTAEHHGVCAKAMYDYEAEDVDELPFKEGDIISDINMVDEGWWTGFCNGKSGLFPAYAFSF